MKHHIRSINFLKLFKIPLSFLTMMKSFHSSFFITQWNLYQLLDRDCWHNETICRLCTALSFEINFLYTNCGYVVRTKNSHAFYALRLEYSCQLILVAEHGCHLDTISFFNLQMSVRFLSSNLIKSEIPFYYYYETSYLVKIDFTTVMKQAT
jgi:hypothetical protein